MALKPTYEDLEQRIRDLEKAIAEHRDISSEMEKSRLKLTEAQNVIKSEAQKAAILNGITTNLAFVNEKFEILWANKASAESVGKTLSELIGKKCHELWADPQAPCDGCPTVKAFETRKTEHLIIRTPDGRVWDEKGEPVFDENGKILGVLEIAHDITEKIRAEEALKESENRYRALVENSSELIFQVGTDGRFTFANRSFYEVLDYTRAETEILNGFDLVHPDDLEMVTQQFGRLMKGEKISLEYRYQKKDGRYIYLHNNAVPLLDKNHQIVGALGVARDISSQKETELALKKSEQKFKELFDSITDLIYVQDLEGRFLSFNPAMQKLLDYEKEEMIGRKTSDFMDPKWRPLFESDYLEALKQNGYQEGISVYCRKDGQKLYLEYRSKLVYPEEGEPYITGMGRDVTPRIKAKKEKKHLREQLLHSQKMEAIGTLTGGIAHDYNNLLSIIMGNLSLAKEEAAPGSELSVFLGEIGGASEKLRNLTHELMALARGGAPVKKLGPLTELFGIASEVVPAEGGILLEESISKDLWHVPHDSHKMRSVLGNVLSNAVEAMPHGGTLSIAAKNLRVDDEPADIRLQSMKNGDYVLITIKDQGKGIPKEHLSKIFDPYFSTKAMGVQKGMGLGLATSYAIVQKHGGHITVDSAPGEGTTVKIYLPAQSKPAKIDVKTPTEDNGAFPVRRVLVMDDEEMLRNLAEKMLEKLGFVVETVKDGQEAIEACRKQKGLGEPFDAVILDLTIKGGMGGEQAIGELLKIDPKIKAIVSSGYFNDPVMSDFQKWGFVGAMAKPYEKKTLKELLESILG